MYKSAALAIGACALLLPLSAYASAISTDASVQGNTATVSIHSDTSLPSGLIDLELYDKNYDRVAQAFTEANLSQPLETCTWNMSAPAGSYVLKIGTFSTNWSTLYDWNDGAALLNGPLTGDNAIHCGSSVPSFTTSTAVDTSSANSDSIDTTVQADQAVQNVLVDVEVYGANGSRIGQWIETDTLSANVPLHITNTLSKPAAGTYTVKVGLFSSDWSKLYNWNNDAGSFVSMSGSAAPVIHSSATYSASPSEALSTAVMSDQDIANALVDTEVYNSLGNKVLQHFTTQDLQANATSTLSWTLPNDLANGNYAFKVGVFSSDWSHLYNWNNDAGSVTVDTTPTTGVLSMSVDPSSPGYMQVAGGTTGVTLGKYQLHASGESVQVNTVGLKLLSGSPSDIQRVYLYVGSTLVGIADFGTSNMATSTLSTSIVVPSGTDVPLTLKADLSRVGVMQTGVNGDLIKIDPTEVMGTGESSGNTIVASGVDGAAGVRLFATFPTVAAGLLPQNGVGDGRLMQFTVTANSSNSLALDKFVFSIATTSANVSNLQLYAYTDPNYSEPMNTGLNGGLIGTAVPMGNGTYSVTTAGRPLELGAGMTGYFQLRGQVQATQPDSKVTTTLLGDSQYSGLYQASDVTGNFVWSDNATTTANFTDAAWSNGYGVFGLPAIGLNETRGI